MKTFKVKNEAGQTFEVDEDKVGQAESDGFLPVVSNGKQQHRVSFADLPKAQADGFRPWNDLAAEAEAEATRQAEFKYDHGSKTEAALRGLAQGASLRWADEAVAGVKAPFSDKSYDELVDYERRANAAAKSSHPYVYGGTEIGGAVGTGLLTGATSLPALAALGAVDGLGGSEADTLGGLTKDAAIGGAFGFAGGKVASKLSTAAPATVRGGQKLLQKVAGVSDEALASYRANPKLFEEHINNPNKLVQEINTPVSSKVDELAAREAAAQDLAKKQQALTYESQSLRSNPPEVDIATARRQIKDKIYDREGEVRKALADKNVDFNDLERYLAMSAEGTEGANAGLTTRLADQVKSKADYDALLNQTRMSAEELRGIKQATNAETNFANQFADGEQKMLGGGIENYLRDSIPEYGAAMSGYDKLVKTSQGLAKTNGKPTAELAAQLEQAGRSSDAELVRKYLADRVKLAEGIRETRRAKQLTTDTVNELKPGAGEFGDYKFVNKVISPSTSDAAANPTLFAQKAQAESAAQRLGDFIGDSSVPQKLKDWNQALEFAPRTNIDRALKDATGAAMQDMGRAGRTTNALFEVVPNLASKTLRKGTRVSSGVESILGKIEVSDTAAAALEKALSRGPAAVTATHHLLMQKDPEYRQSVLEGK